MFIEFSCVFHIRILDKTEPRLDPLTPLDPPAPLTMVVGPWGVTPSSSTPSPYRKSLRPAVEGLPTPPTAWSAPQNLSVTKTLGWPHAWPQHKVGWSSAPPQGRGPQMPGNSLRPRRRPLTMSRPCWRRKICLQCNRGRWNLYAALYRRSARIPFWPTFSSNAPSPSSPWPVSWLRNPSNLACCQIRCLISLRTSIREPCRSLGWVRMISGCQRHLIPR